MATQLVPDGIEIVFNAVQNGVPIVNVYHVKHTATITGAVLQDYAEAFYDWWADQLMPILNNSYVLNTITATDMETGSGPQYTLSLSSANQGTLTGEQVAGNAALCVSWRTASIGRSFRGRTYIGGLDAAATETAQVVSASFQGAIGDAAIALLDIVETIGGALCVLSRYASGVLRITGLLTEIIGVIVDSKIDSQRRRTAN
jgi:hypothetical protein